MPLNSRSLAPHFPTTIYLIVSCYCRKQQLVRFSHGQRAQYFITSNVQLTIENGIENPIWELHKYVHHNACSWGLHFKPVRWFLLMWAVNPISIQTGNITFKQCYGNKENDSWNFGNVAICSNCLLVDISTKSKAQGPALEGRKQHEIKHKWDP